MYSFVNAFESQIYFHKTFELINIINDKCDLIITMNVTYSLVKPISDPQKTILYFVSCSRDPKKYVKQSIPIATCHLKLYRTDDYVFISTANLSLSSWDEITIRFKRTEEFDKFIDLIVKNLKIRNEFLKHFW